MADVRILSEAAIVKALDKSPLLKAMMAIGFKVEARAKSLTNNVMVGVVTGRLSGSITTVAAQREGSPVVLVGTNVEYACIMDKHTDIACDPTIGPASKSICMIRPGDRVLTQTGEYRDVTATSRFPVTEKPDLVTIKVPWRAGKDHTITTTADHLLLVVRDGVNKWVAAGDVRTTDGLLVRRKLAHNKGTGRRMICEWCGKQFQRAEIGGRTVGQGRRYCSPACRDAHWAAGADPKVGRARGEAYSLAASERRTAYYAANPDKHPNRNQGRPTGPEKTVGFWLALRGIDWQHQHRVGDAFVDFYDPVAHRAYEVDGAYWHQDQTADIQRDRRLLQADPDLEIIHLHFHSPRHSPPTFDPNPLPGVYYVACNPSPDSYADPATYDVRPPTSIRPWTFERSTKPRASSVPMLYDLTVDGVTSFVANGIVVHNSFVHNGTRPHWPPRAPMAAWLAAKGGDPRQAFLVQRAIARRGTPPKPFLTTALREVAGGR